MPLGMCKTPASALPAYDSGAHPAEAPAVEVGDRLRDLGLRVHHERTVADDGLVDRLAAQDQQRRVAVRLDRDVVALAVEQHDLRFARDLRRR